jgi:CW-type Zinc Finger
VRRTATIQPDALSPSQQAVQEQYRRTLEEDQYSAAGSIVDTESEEEDNFTYRGQSVRLDKAFMQQTVRKMNALERNGLASTFVAQGGEDCDDDDDGAGSSGNKRNAGKTRKKKKRKDEASQLMLDDGKNSNATCVNTSTARDPFMLDGEEDVDRDGGSIFGATTGASNSTWVECDKCKKWRRLRGVVDEKKLPSKWYCSMNKNDPERARCSAPEEEYEAPHTPESAADARIRKHLRVWVRRLQCNEAYEARLPTLTRGKKRSSPSSTSKDPYEWVKCCNPSCGKWRPILRVMEAKSVIERAADGEWFCVMNTWDEKTASCAAPQEALPAIGCPPWVLQDDPPVILSRG